MKRFIKMCVFFFVIVGICCVSCSSTQRITIKQEQQDQKQETVIENETIIYNNV